MEECCQECFAAAAQAERAFCRAGAAPSASAKGRVKCLGFTHSAPSFWPVRSARPPAFLFWMSPLSARHVARCWRCHSGRLTKTDAELSAGDVDTINWRTRDDLCWVETRRQFSDGWTVEQEP